jgi:hypothetical protein
MLGGIHSLTSCHLFLEFRFGRCWKVLGSWFDFFYTSHISDIYYTYKLLTPWSGNLGQWGDSVQMSWAETAVLCNVESMGGYGNKFVSMLVGNCLHVIVQMLVQSNSPVPPELARHEASKFKPGLFLHIYWDDFIMELSCQKKFPLDDFQEMKSTYISVHIWQAQSRIALLEETTLYLLIS